MGHGTVCNGDTSLYTADLSRVSETRSLASTHFNVAASYAEQQQPDEILSQHSYLRTDNPHNVITNPHGS